MVQNERHHWRHLGEGRRDRLLAPKLGGPYGPVVRTSVLALMPADDHEDSEFHPKTPGQEVEKKWQLDLWMEA